MDLAPNKFHLVISSSDGKRLLVRRSGHTLSLPLASQPNDDSTPWIFSWDAFTEDLRTVIFAALGIDAYVVTVLWNRRPDPPDFTEVVLQVEPLQYSFALSEGLTWLDRAAVLTANWQSPHQDCDVSLLLDSYFARIDGRAPASPSPWRTVGWFQDIESWALSTVKQHGMTIVGTLRQKRNMHQSTVLSCEVKELRVNGKVLDNWRSNNSIYVKASHPYVPEAERTLTVSSAMKGFVPKILAIDEKRNAMIQLGALPMDDSDPKAVMEMLADLHIGSIQHVDELKAGGVPNRGLAWLSSSITAILCDPILQICDKDGSLSLLRGRISEVQRICERILEYGIPDTLVHGDCDEDNIRCGMEPGHAYSFIDWASCCVGHPLFDLARITLQDEWGYNAYEGAKDSYFEKWTPFACYQRMKEAFALVWPVFLCYNLNILLNMFKMTEPIERPSKLLRIESRLEAILAALDVIPGGERHSWDGEGDEPNTYHFVIPNASGDSILACRSGNNMSLPVISPPKTDDSIWVNNWDKDVEELRSVIKTEMGLNVFALRPVWIRPKTRYGIEEVVLVLELLDDISRTPDGLQWISRADALVGKWEEICQSGDLKGLLEKFFDETSAASVPDRHVAWRAVGWFKEMRTWVLSVLLKKGMELARPVEIVRNTSDACVLRCTVRRRGMMKEQIAAKDAEIFYVKTEHPSFSMARVMATIPSIALGIVPAVVAVDEARHTFMVRDAGCHNSSILNTEVLMKTLADVHTRSIDHLHTLKEAGVPVFSTEWVGSHIPAILKSRLLRMCGETEKVARLRYEIPRLQGCCRELMSFSIPETLVHGDFHPENVGKLVADSHYQIFDWSAAYIGHPFCDFAVMQFSTDDSETDQEVAENTYFGFWKKYGNTDALRRAAQLALVSYFCLNLYRLQRLYEVTEAVEHESIFALCKESVGHIIYGLDDLEAGEGGTVERRR